MGLIVTVPPTVYPVSLAEAKAHCRVDSADEDAYISGLIAAATDWVEKYTGTSISPKTLQLIIDKFSSAIAFPRGPVLSLVSFVYDDADGLENIVDPSLYTTDFTSDRQWIVLNKGDAWPVTLDAINVVRITYTAGYVTAPDSIKHAILLLIGQWFDNRAAVSDGGMREVPFTVSALLENYRTFQ